MNLFQEDGVQATTFSNRPVWMCDGGANRSVTNNIFALHVVQPIPIHNIGSILAQVFNVSVKNGTTLQLLIVEPSLYLCSMPHNAIETVISPTGIVNMYPDKYDSVLQNFDVGGNHGQLIFYKKDDPYPNHIHS